MAEKTAWQKGLHYAGLAAFIIGTIDPLEGSVLIALGSLLMTLAARQRGHRFFKPMLYATLSIAFGVAALFYLSSLGGFGGRSNLSWWWGLLIIPYPVGWITIIVLLLSGSKKKGSRPEAGPGTAG